METDKAPTRAAVLELRAEREVVVEAYDFLDEKRLLLAAELLRQLRHYEVLKTTISEKTETARDHLLAAVSRHGLQGLEVYPSLSLDDARLDMTKRNLMGVMLQQTAFSYADASTDRTDSAVNRSAEAQQCAQVFSELTALAAELAGVSGNLYRLFAEYRLTERRARALENVFLPDIEQALSRMTTWLEEQELEDAIRARPRGRGERPAS